MDICRSLVVEVGAVVVGVDVVSWLVVLSVGVVLTNVVAGGDVVKVVVLTVDDAIKVHKRKRCST